MPRKPKGTNRLSARRIFNERKFYKENSYPYAAGSPTSPIDFWYNETDIPELPATLYGRLNNKGDAVYPSESILKQVASSAGTVLAINFVADAFNSLAAYIRKQKLENTAAAPGFLAAFEAKKGWKSANVLYHEHVNLVYSILAETVLSTNKREILNFNDFTMFTKKYSDGLRETGVPITKTGFIKSSFCPPTISGLCIEIADFDHSEDQDKVKKFIEHNVDGCFECYVNYANSYGFKVDKNAPWRLVADLSSPRMQYFMGRYGITIDNVFEKYFYSAHRLDFESIKFYMRQFYNSYVGVNPTETRPLVLPRLKTKNYIFRRQQMGLQEYDDLYGENYVLDVYRHFRMNEAKVECDKKMCERAQQKMQKLLKYVDKEAVLDYINNMTKPEKFATEISLMGTVYRTTTGGLSLNSGASAVTAGVTISATTSAVTAGVTISATTDGDTYVLHSGPDDTLAIFM